MPIIDTNKSELHVHGRLLASREHSDAGITIHDGKNGAWVDEDEIPHLIEFLLRFMPPQDSATPPPSGAADSRSACPSPGSAPAPDYCPVTDLVDAGGLSPDAAAALVRALEAMVAKAVGRAVVPLAALGEPEWKPEWQVTEVRTSEPSPPVWLPNCKPGDVCVRRDGERGIYAYSDRSGILRHNVGGYWHADNGRAFRDNDSLLDIIAVIPSDHSGPSGTACDTLAKEYAR